MQYNKLQRFCSLRPPLSTLLFLLYALGHFTVSSASTNKRTNRREAALRTICYLRLIVFAGVTVRNELKILCSLYSSKVPTWNEKLSKALNHLVRSWAPIDYVCLCLSLKAGSVWISVRLKGAGLCFDFLFTPAFFKQDLGGMLMVLNQSDCADKGGCLHKRSYSLRVIEMAVSLSWFLTFSLFTEELQHSN